MSTTVTYAGRISLSVQATASLSGDKTGQEVFEEAIALVAGRGDCPEIVGALAGDFSISAATDFLLAHATDPLQGAGSAVYSEGFDPSGTELFCLLLVNEDDTESLKVERGAANGLPVFDQAGEGVNLGPNGGMLFLYEPAGFGALTTGSNDKLTATPSANTVTGRLVALYKAA